MAPPADRHRGDLNVGQVHPPHSRVFVRLAVLRGWTPATGRAHLAWQLMHVAATGDRHLHVRMTGSEPQEPEWVRRFANGSVPDEDIPPVAVVSG